MTDRAREVLNALLGLDRDTYKSSNARPVNERICKYMLVSFCPFMLLQNTRKSIGKCRYTNYEEYYKTEYVRKGSVGLEAYEWDFIRLLVEIVLKVQSSNAGIREPATDDLDLLERIKRQEEVFNQKLELAGSLGMAGDVEEAFSTMVECESIKEELERTKEAYYVRSSGAGMEQCEICGVNITLSDTDSKIDKHLNGRLHRGHMLIRSKLAELLKKFRISSIAEIFPEGISFKYIRDSPS